MEVTKEQFDIRLEEFMNRINEFMKTDTYPDRKMLAMQGKKYVRVCTSDFPGHKCAYAFIEMSTGNLYKPASWAAPAKHARSNIFNDDYGMSACGPYSVVYLRG